MASPYAGQSAITAVKERKKSRLSGSNRPKPSIVYSPSTDLRLCYQEPVNGDLLNE